MLSGSSISRLIVSCTLRRITASIGIGKGVRRPRVGNELIIHTCCTHFFKKRGDMLQSRPILDLDFLGGFAYVADYGSLQVIDVFDPSNPTLAGSYDTPGSATGVFISGIYAYVADLDSGLQIIDVFHPENPAFAGSYDTASRALGVFVAGDYTYVADGFSLMILRFYPQTGIEETINIPEQFSREQNYPNPFNASTTIKYNLTEPSDVAIDILDLLARKIETLIQDEQPAGSHQVIWNTEGLPSGIYFYRIQAGEYSEAKKMILLK